MNDSKWTRPDRRSVLGAGAALLGGLATPAFAQSSVFEPIPENDPEVRRNISSFRALNWQPYFSSTAGGAILVDTTSRALHFWSADQTIYKLYPTSVPVSEELTRRGRTSVVQKVEGPSWSPTPSMKIRNPEWPDYVPPGPDNPLGTHALYLSWKYYRIHGTHDTRKIGRPSSNGCIGLYNEHIAELFALVSPGAQVLLI
ncbi:L,D-transpeptidase [Tropicimonas sp. IMCC6043]|uniref:L,D-transpeptidase n=1 Tax=Tropicimonas sp. IMCC6043 TaxID=2510645 RepID=UPI00101BC086|nr:L,D-transpeptidase [Tropicimonas sp. IMCC6043]RYH10857.1 L,D-transpeptidase [Tropicimonas sp. IMCC6043]